MVESDRSEGTGTVNRMTGVQRTECKGNRTEVTMSRGPEKGRSRSIAKDKGKEIMQGEQKTEGPPGSKDMIGALEVKGLGTTNPPESTGIAGTTAVGSMGSKVTWRTGTLGETRSLAEATAKTMACPERGPWEGSVQGSIR